MLGTQELWNRLQHSSKGKQFSFVNLGPIVHPMLGRNKTTGICLDPDTVHLLQKGTEPARERSGLKSNSEFPGEGDADDRQVQAHTSGTSWLK